MKQTITAIFLSTFLFANDQIPAAPQKHPILLKNGFIHTISNGVSMVQFYSIRGK